MICAAWAMTLHNGFQRLHALHVEVEHISCAAPCLFSTNRVPSRRVTVVTVDRNFCLKDLIADKIGVGFITAIFLVANAVDKVEHETDWRDAGAAFSGTANNRNSASSVD